MKPLRSISLMMLACSAMCFLIAYDRYTSAVATAKKFAELVEGVDYETIRVPNESLVLGTLGVTLLVSGVLCFLEHRKQKSTE